MGSRQRPAIDFGRKAHFDAYNRAFSFWTEYDEDGDVRPAVASQELESELVMSFVKPDEARRIACIALTDIRDLKNPETMLD